MAIVLLSKIVQMLETNQEILVVAASTQVRMVLLTLNHLPHLQLPLQNLARKYWWLMFPEALRTKLTQHTKTCNSQAVKVTPQVEVWETDIWILTVSFLHLCVLAGQIPNLQHSPDSQIILPRLHLAHPIWQANQAVEMFLLWDPQSISILPIRKLSKSCSRLKFLQCKIVIMWNRLQTLKRGSNHPLRHHRAVTCSFQGILKLSWMNHKNPALSPQIKPRVKLRPHHLPNKEDLPEVKAVQRHSKLFSLLKQRVGPRVALVLSCQVINRIMQISLAFRMLIARGLLNQPARCSNSHSKVRLTTHRLFNNLSRMLTPHTPCKRHLTRQE